MTADGFRRFALALPEVLESAHMGHPDFRIGGKIFATLGYPDAGSAMVKLTAEQQEVFTRVAPATFAPASGTWGRRGSTTVLLRHAPVATVRDALASAWRNVAPKRLATAIG